MVFSGCIGHGLLFTWNCTLILFIRFNYSNGDGLPDDLGVEYGSEFTLMPNSPWNFSFGIAGIYRPRKKSLSINILQYEITNSFCFDSGF